MTLKLFAICLIAAHLLLLSQLRFEVWPEMLVMPYLMKNGFELYRDMIVPWTPGLMWILSLWFRLVGLGVARLKLLTWMIIAITDFLVFRIASKRYGAREGLIALVFFVLLHPIFDGNGLWFDLAVMPLLLLSFFHKEPFLLGLSFMIKQSAIWLLFAALRQWRRVITGMGIGILLSSIWFWIRGTLGDYRFWAYDFSFRILPTMPGHRDVATLRHWVFALAPLVLVFGWRGVKTRTLRWVVDPSDPSLWAILSIPFSLPRFGLFHLQPMLAFLSLSLAVTHKSEKHSHRVSLIFYFLVTAYIVFGWTRLFKSAWRYPDRFLEPEVYQFAATVAVETDPHEPVLLVNAPELVYVLADRVPPKPWLTQFPWFLELPGFQQKLIQQFQAQNLRQVFEVAYQNQGEFTPGSYQPMKLLEYTRSLNKNP